MRGEQAHHAAEVGGAVVEAVAQRDQHVGGVLHARRVDRGVDVGERVRVVVRPSAREPVGVAREPFGVEPAFSAERALDVGEPERVAVQTLVAVEGLAAALGAVDARPAPRAAPEGE